MKRKIFLIAILAPSIALAQVPAKIDSVALLILDRMSDVIGDLGSCSFHLSVAADENENGYGLEKKFMEQDVFMVGPDKMLVQSKESNNHKGYWYNGTVVVYYSYTENNYVVVDGQPDILSTIDSVNHYYGLEFPAADFFYPTFTDDILEQFDQVVFLGNKLVNGKDCFHILASNKSITAQVWISNDALTTPQKFVISYKDKPGSPQYEASFSDWQLNPDIPLSIFEFIPPPGSRQIAVLAKSNN